MSRRNWLIRLLQAVVIVAVALGIAFPSFAFDMPALIVKKKASAAVCSPTTGNVLTEGFENLSGSSNYQSNVGMWTQTGTTIDNQAALSGSPPANSCTKGVSFNTGASGASKAMWDRGTVIDNNMTTDVVFDFYITSVTLDNFANIPILSWAGAVTGNGQGGLQLYNNNGTLSVRCSNGIDSSTSTPVPVSATTWYTVTIHYDATAASSYCQVVGGGSTTCDAAAECAFTRTQVPSRYLITGPYQNVGAAESVNYTIGYVRINTP